MRRTGEQHPSQLVCNKTVGETGPNFNNFQKRGVTSVAIVISTVSTVSEQEQNGRAGVMLGSESTSVRLLYS